MTSPPLLWSSLYIPTVDQDRLAKALHEVYTTAGYLAFNPFPGGTGTPSGMTQRVRLFVAPTERGWTRVLGEPDSELLPGLAQVLNTAFLYAWVTPDNSAVEVIGGGDGDLTPFQRVGESASDSENPPPEPDNAPGVFADLAREYGVDASHAENLIQKTTRTVFGKLNKRTEGEAGDMQTAAMQSITDQFSWNLPTAQALTKFMQTLTVPDNWRDPDFKNLSAAYHIACLLDIDEDAPLLPGDEAVLDRVEYPLDYVAAYFAR